MKCKVCKNRIPDGSIYCNWCGERQIRERQEKKEIKVPKPRQLPSGKWFVQLRLQGESISITEDTEAVCIARAKALKAGVIENNSSTGTGLTIAQMIDKYLDANRARLSPLSVRTFENIKRNRFQAVMHRKWRETSNWQTICNKELSHFSPKTLKTTWGLICTAARFCGVMAPDIILPKVPKNPRPFLEPDEILVFIKAIEGQRCELAALLALHSLRCSEIYGMSVDKIDLKRRLFLVKGALVLDENNKPIKKDTNKSIESQRYVPIMIPRLEELFKECIQHNEFPLMSQPGAYKQINRICRENQLPEIGFHGLRHSFASLGYHLDLGEREVMEIGGWSDPQTVHKIYTHLSQMDKRRAENKMRAFYQNANENANG